MWEKVKTEFKQNLFENAFGQNRSECFLVIRLLFKNWCFKEIQWGFELTNPSTFP